MNSLFIEYICMSSGFDKGQGQNVIFHEVYEQPIRLNMALAKARPIPMEFVENVGSNGGLKEWRREDGARRYQSRRQTRSSGRYV